MKNIYIFILCSIYSFGNAQNGACFKRQYDFIYNNPNANGVAVGDLNNDGKKDFVVSKTSTATNDAVSVYIAKGGGYFNAPVSYTVNGDDPAVIAVGDLDGDGKDDVVTGNQATGTLSFLKSGVGGVLAAPTITNVFSVPVDIEVADVNGDGWNDVLALTQTTNKVMLYVNAGSGLFNPAVSYTLSQIAYDLNFEDIDNDGNKDIVVSIGGNIATLKNNANGTFQLPNYYPTTYSARYCKAIDLNNDGFKDVVGIHSTGYFTLTNNGAGGLIAISQNTYGIAAAGTPYDLSSGDYNGDGKTDILIGSPTSSPYALYQLYLGNGTATNMDFTRSYQPTALTMNTGTTPIINRFISADMNADGYLDILHTESNNGQNYVSLGLGSNTGGFWPMRPNLQMNAYDLAVADFNSDGKKDIAVITGSLNTLSVYKGNNNYGFGSISYLNSLGNNPRSVNAADFNNDGKLDVVVGTRGTSKVNVLFGNGAGTFTNNIAVVADSMPRYALPMDIDSDGDMDIVAGCEYNGKIAVIKNNGGGSFSAPTLINSYGTSNPTPKLTWIRKGDYDMDGIQDFMILLNSGTSGYFQFFKNNGSGVFTPDFPFSLNNGGFGVISFETADIDNDGALDIITGGSNGINDVTVGWGIGNGTFSSFNSITVGAQPQKVTVADINNDGKLDIISTNYTGNSFSIIYNNGTRTLSTPATFGTTGNPFGIVATDLNNDGGIDLAITEYGAHSLQLFFNQPSQVSASASTTFCAGGNVILTAPAATSYTWSTGANTQSITATTAGIYTVNITPSNTGTCYVTSNAINVTVNSLPTITAVTSNTMLCIGQSATLTANGGSIYSWDTGDNTATTIVAPNVNTTYTVSGTDNNNCMNTAIITQSVSVCTNIKQIDDNSVDVSVYPNPFNEELTFQLNQTENANVTIYNTIGQVVLKTEINSENDKVNTMVLHKGVYYVLIESKNAKTSLKLVK